MSGAAVSIRNITDLQDATGDITVSVTTGGNDAASAARRPRELAGDFSSLPFASPQAAFDFLPKNTAGRRLRVSVGAGTFPRPVVRGFTGGGTLELDCATTPATLASGSASGSAGTGTSSTSLVKPNAAANWTANDLRGRLVKITVAGVVHWRVILSNTTNAASVRALDGLVAGVAFEIVAAGSFFSKDGTTNDGIVFEDCSCRIVVTAPAPTGTGVADGIRFERCVGGVTARGLTLAIDAVNTMRARNCYAIDFTDSSLSGAANATLEDCVVANADRLFADNGSVELVGCGRSTVGLSARAVVANALKITDCRAVRYALNTDACLATPLVVENSGTTAVELAGSNPGTTRGASFARGGQNIVTGATIAGSDAQQVLVENQPIAWSSLSAQGSASSMSTSIHWGTGTDVVMRKIRIPSLGGDELTNEGDETTGGTKKHFGTYLWLGNAGGGKTGPGDTEAAIQATGTNQAGAALCRYTHTLVGSVAGGGTNGVKFRPSPAAIMAGSVMNRSGAAINLFPSDGGYINDLLQNAAISLPDDTAALWWYVGDPLVEDRYVVALVSIP